MVRAGAGVWLMWNWCESYSGKWCANQHSFQALLCQSHWGKWCPNARLCERDFSCKTQTNTSYKCWMTPTIGRRYRQLGCVMHWVRHTHGTVAWLMLKHDWQFATDVNCIALIVQSMHVAWAQAEVSWGTAKVMPLFIVVATVAPLHFIELHWLALH